MFPFFVTAITCTSHLYNFLIIDEKIGTPHSKSPPAHGCETWQQAHTRPSCKSKPPKGSVG